MNEHDYAWKNAAGSEAQSSTKLTGANAVSCIAGDSESAVNVADRFRNSPSGKGGRAGLNERECDQCCIGSGDVLVLVSALKGGRLHCTVLNCGTDQQLFAEYSRGISETSFSDYLGLLIMGSVKYMAPQHLLLLPSFFSWGKVLAVEL